MYVTCKHVCVDRCVFAKFPVKSITKHHLPVCVKVSVLALDSTYVLRKVYMHLPYLLSFSQDLIWGGIDMTSSVMLEADHSVSAPLVQK